MVDAYRKGTRFVTSLIPGLLLLVGLITVAGAAYERMSGAGGAVLSIGGAVLVGLGTLTARAVLRDHASLRRLRRHAFRPGARLEHGQRIAIEGRLVCDSPRVAPLVAPISRRRCAAYAFRIRQLRRVSAGGSSQTRRVSIAAGVGAVPFALVAGTRRFPVRAVPEVEDSMRILCNSREHAQAVRALLERLMDAPAGSTVPIEEARLALRDGLTGPIESRVRTYTSPPLHDASANRLSIEEVCVPVDRAISLVGSFDAAGGALVPEPGPLGRALHLYDGPLDEVEAGLAGEVRVFGATAAVLLIVGLTMLSIPFLQPI